MKKRVSALISAVLILVLLSTSAYAAGPDAVTPGDPEPDAVIETQEGEVPSPAEEASDPSSVDEPIADAEPASDPAEDTAPADGSGEDTAVETDEDVPGSEASADDVSDPLPEEVPEAEDASEEALTEEPADMPILTEDGATFSLGDGSLTYMVLSESEKTVAVTGGAEGLTSVTIPAAVTYNDETYKVTEIAKKAFENCAAIKELTFAPGSNLVAIREDAFAYNKKDGSVPATLSSLTFPASLETVEDGAFHCIPVENFALENGSKLKEIPCGFLSADGKDGYPGTETECETLLDFIHMIFIQFTSFTPEDVAKACDCLKTVDFGDGNSLELIGMGAFKNQTHLTKINFGENANGPDLVLANGVFVAAGNQTGIDTLVLPANLKKIGYGIPRQNDKGEVVSEGDSGSFNFANVKHLVFSDNCRLEVIPEGFFEVTGEGDNGHPGRHSEAQGSWWSSNYTYEFVKDPVQIAANSLETVSFGKNNRIRLIEDGAFKNQNHLKSIDFGTSTVGLTIDCGAFVGAGNNGYLVEQGVDTDLNAGVVNLTFPANLTALNYGAFDWAKIVNLTFSDNCKLAEIPYHFLGINENGCNGYPGKKGSGDNASFVKDQAQIESNSLVSINFGKNNSLAAINNGAFLNQSHLKSINFGTSSAELLTLGDGTFIGVGNNGYLVDQGIDTELNEGIETLVLPANLTFDNEWGGVASGAFEYAKIKNLVFSDNSKATKIPSGFMGVHGYGNNGYPGMKSVYDNETGTSYPKFVNDSAQIAANSLESIRFGNNNSLKNIYSGAFYNQSHLKVIDFGTPKTDRLTLGGGTFIGAGNNGYLVDNGVDEALNDGIKTLKFPANLTFTSSGSTYSSTGNFDYASVKNLVISDNSILEEIPYNFLGICGASSNGKPGEAADWNSETYEYENQHFVKDSAQLAANRLETINFGKNNSIKTIKSSAFKNQSHLTKIDFGTSKADSLTIDCAAFDGVGNNNYLYENGVDPSKSAGIGTLTLPANLVKLSPSAFSDSGVKDIVFSDGIKLDSLDPGVFQDLDRMTELVLGDDCPLTELDGGVFSKCDELTKIDLRGSGITEIGDSIKQNPKLTSVYFPETLTAVTWADTNNDGIIDEGECPFYECDAVNELHFTSPDPANITFTDGVFSSLNNEGVIYVPHDTTPEALSEYKDKLAAAGLSFGTNNWDIKKAVESLRVYGKNRATTSLSVAEQLKALNGGAKFKAVVLCTGENYPDALAGGYLAAVKKAPILLLRNKAADRTKVVNYIKANVEKNSTIYVLGSTSAVPDSWISGLKSGFKIKRLAGKNRFGTNAAILNEIGTGKGKEIIVTTGYDYPDALCASAIDKPLLITDTKKTKKLNADQIAYLKKIKSKKPTFYIVGTPSLMNTFASQLKSYGTVKWVTKDTNAINRSVDVAKQFFKNPDTVTLATSEDYPDGLCGGVLAGKYKAPLLLTKKASASAKVKTYTKDNGVTYAIVYGSTNAVSDNALKGSIADLMNLFEAYFK